MKVHFTAEVMREENAFNDLDRLVDFFIEERHLWVIDDPEEYLQTQWIQSETDSRAGKRNREALEKCFTTSFYPSTNNMHQIEIDVSLKSQDDDCLSPTDALKCLSTPAYVVVENSESDGAFLSAIAYTLGYHDLLGAYKSEYWNFQHAGGCGEIPKRIQETLDKAVGPIRIFALADSDRESPEDVITGAIKKVDEYCADKDIPCCILKKRKIENYLPLEALSSIRNRKRRETFSAFSSISQEQRDYYEMKNGFKKCNRTRQTQISVKQKDLYSGINDFHLNRLCGGFGGNIWELFKEPEKYLTKEALSSTCHNDLSELENLLNQIEALL